MNSRNTRGPAYGRNRGRGLLAPHRAGYPGPAVLLPVPGGLCHSETRCTHKRPGRLLPAFDDKYRPVPSGGPGAQGRGQTWPDFWRATFTPPPAADPGRPPQFPPPGRILCCGSDREQQVGVGGEGPAVRAGEGLQLIGGPPGGIHIGDQHIMAVSHSFRSVRGNCRQVHLPACRRRPSGHPSSCRSGRQC